MDKHNYSAPVSLEKHSGNGHLLERGNGARTQGGDPVSVGCLK